MEWTTWLLVVVVIVAVAVAVWGASGLRRDRLRRRFGAEYERAIGSSDSRRGAEAQLRDRLKRHRALELRALEPEAAASYVRRWMRIQEKFVDTPDDACSAAEQLLDEVMRARGYPVDEDFDTQADLVSVDYPDLVADYRRVHEAMHGVVTGKPAVTGKAAVTEKVPLEDLRNAFLIYRSLFRRLLDVEAPMPSGDVGAGERAAGEDQSGYAGRRAS